MIALLAATAAAAGVHLLVAESTGGAGRRSPARLRRRWSAVATSSGLDARRLVVSLAVAALLGAFGGLAVFGAPLPAAVCGVFAATTPLAALDASRLRRRERAAEAWPGLLDEMRVQIVSLGRSVPRALFAVGERAPEEYRPAFVAARREWALSVDFGRALGVLTRELADPTADAVAETLLVAHEVGGGDLDRRLADLAEARRAEVGARRDAHSRLAGARFARLFVLLVPAGMALAGLSIGDGRAAYRTPTGQAVVVVALLLVAACWWWAGRIMRLPEPRRVFGATTVETAP